MTDSQEEKPTPFLDFCVGTAEIAPKVIKTIYFGIGALLLIFANAAFSNSGMPLFVGLYTTACIVCFKIWAMYLMLWAGAEAFARMLNWSITSDNANKIFIGAMNLILLLGTIYGTAQVAKEALPVLQKSTTCASIYSTAQNLKEKTISAEKHAECEASLTGLGVDLDEFMKKSGVQILE